MLANTVPSYLSCRKLLPPFVDVGRFINTVPVRVLHYHQQGTRATCVEPMCQCVSVEDKVSDNSSILKRTTKDGDVSGNEDFKIEADSSITGSQRRTPIKLSFGIDRILEESSRVKDERCKPTATPQHDKNNQVNVDSSSVRRETASIHKETTSVLRQSSSSHRETASAHRGTTPVHGDTTSVHRDMTSAHRETFEKPEYTWEAYGSMKHIQQMNFQQIWLPPTLRNDHTLALDRVCLCSTCLGSSLKPRSLWQAVAQQPNSGHFSGAVKRKRSWSRAVFTSLQRKGLEKRFEVQKYVNKPDRRQLAAALGLTDAQVKVWFQNRRMKWRQNQKQTKDNSIRISTGGNVDISAAPHLQDELSAGNMKDGE